MICAENDSHSQDDEVVRLLLTLSEGLQETLEHLEFDLIWKQYEEGGHWIHRQHGVDDMSIFKHKVMKI
jgi:hypothetical protein